MTTHLRSQTPDKGPDGILASGMKFLKGMGLVGAGVYSICMTGVVSDAIEAASSKPTAVLDTPAKVMMAERVVGIWDGLEDPDVVSRAEHRLLTRILMDRDPDVVNALLPIYQEAYQATLQGDYDYEDLQSYLDVIQMEKATLQDVVKQVTETFHDVAKDEPIVAMITHDLDTIDAKIYEAMQGVRAMADSISGPGAGQPIFDLIMTEVAHDDIRMAFAHYPQIGEGKDPGASNMDGLSGGHRRGDGGCASR